MRKNLTRGLWTPLLCIGMLLLSGCGHGSAITGPGSGFSTACTACTVGGTVTGLSANESVTLLDNGGNSLTANTDGTFMFSSALAGGSRYDVTVQSHTPGISCAVSNGAGTVGTQEVANILVNCAAGTETVLYAFAGGATDGADPQGTLALGSSGTLYGTTYRGGTDGLGTVYQLGSAGGETVLYSFAGGASDGADPRGSLIIDSAGNLYGTTSGGGASGLGTVYEVSPTGAQTVLYSFAGGTTDGEVPLGHLVMGSGGSLYGTTSTGGAYDLGTVFRISLGGVETVLYSFAGTTTHDGAYPRAGLIMDGSGDLYGTTSAGGTYDLGTVFEISASGTETVLHSFAGGTTDGSDPNGSLLLGSSGSLYGTTSTGGAYDLGTVFKLSPDGTEVLLHSFAGGTTDGSSPKAGLIVDSAGNLYGTTSAGGVNDDGTVYELN